MKAPPRLLPLLLPVPAASSRLFETNTRRRCAVLLLSLFLFVSLSIFLSLSPNQLLLRSFDNSSAAAGPTVVAARPNLSAFPSNRAVRELADEFNESSAKDPLPEARENLGSVSILFPDWEVLVIGPAGISGDEEESGFLCVYPNKATSPARFAGNLRATNQSIFKCWLPEKCRRRLQSPVLIRKQSPTEVEGELSVSFTTTTTKSLARWTFLAYESFSTESDVVLFVKGVNKKQGVNRPARELKCVFGNTEDSSASVTTTAVTSSEQEVFRCGHPDLTAYGDNVTDVRITLELPDGVRVPSVAHYSPWRLRRVESETKLQICAATMVYNTAKFLKEWVIYHSGIGVEKFFLYDNGSDDGLGLVVGELNREGYKVETVPWIWAKTQEAGFSHAAVYARESCDWVMYIDVDEFLFSPRWSSAPRPSDRMLKSLIPSKESGGNLRVGQVSIRCNEFGPSGRVTHPPDGVTQGYDCRRKFDNRHKSIVLLEAIDDSLLNAVHHFRLRGGGREGRESFGTKQVGMEAAVVNHYKYQAWSEFRAKFRRRVSAYVVDWRMAVNPGSKDRAPGLGFEPVKPVDWERRFCEVRDERLKSLAQRWFGGRTAGGGGYRMAWQR